MKLLKNISVTTIANVLNAGIPFLLMPVLTKYLSTYEYGQLDIIVTTISFLVPLIGLNFYSGITVFYHDKKINNQIYVGTSLVLTVLSGIIVLFFTGIIYFLNQDLFFKYYIPFIVIFAMFKVISETLSTYLLISQQVFSFGVFKVSRTLLELLLSILFVVLIFLGIKGRILGMGITAFLSFCFALYYFKRKIKVSFSLDKKYLKLGLAYSLPLIFHTIGGYLLNISDRYFIDSMVSTSELGVYSVAYQVGMSFYILQISFNQGWTPYFLKKISTDDFDKLLMVKYTYIYAIISVLVMLLIWWVTPVFYFFIDDDFHSGQFIVPWILLAFLFNGFYLMVVNYLFALKKTAVIAKTTIIVGIFNLILNYFFIPKMGIKGAAISTVISFFASFIFFWWISNKFYPMPWFKFKSVFKF